MQLYQEKSLKYWQLMSPLSVNPLHPQKYQLNGTLVATWWRFRAVCDGRLKQDNRCIWWCFVDEGCSQHLDPSTADAAASEPANDIVVVNSHVCQTRTLKTTTTMISVSTSLLTPSPAQLTPRCFWVWCHPILLHRILGTYSHFDWLMLHHRWTASDKP